MIPIPGATDEGAVSSAALALAPPVEGRVRPLAEVPDKVFASGAIGPGVGLIPAEGKVLAPIEGTVVTAMAARLRHQVRQRRGGAGAHRHRHGAAGGQGLHPRRRAANGAPGDLLAEVDLAVINEAGYDPTTVLVVTNTGQLTSVQTQPQAPSTKASPS